MQKGFILLALALLCSYPLFQGQDITADTAQATLKPTEKEVISWESKIHDFGEIPQNVPAQAEFVLTNNSDEMMIITNVKGSCGCTAAKHDEAPVAPGKSTTITATYNAAKIGPFTKSITVKTSLTEQPELLKIKGEVITP
ncbi:MAG: DUF1573 domain-containing protein [Bacteroidota bacterium]